MIWITQWLCPSRHALCSNVWDERVTNAEAAERDGWAEAQRLGLRARCGICGSHDIHVEAGRTRFRTLEEAWPALHANQQAQMESRAALDAAGLTYDVQQDQKN